MLEHKFPPATQILADDLLKHKRIKMQQIREMAEWIGIETRNKYQLTDENDSLIAYAAEDQKGALGFLMRQYLGHWRTFDFHVFNFKREHALTLRHPFRWFFQRLEVYDESGKMLEGKFAMKSEAQSGAFGLLPLLSMDEMWPMFRNVGRDSFLKPSLIVMTFSFQCMEKI